MAPLPPSKVVPPALFWMHFSWQPPTSFSFPHEFLPGFGHTGHFEVHVGNKQPRREGFSLPGGAKGHFSKPNTWSYPDRALLHIYWVLCWILLAFALTSHPHHFFISYFLSPQTTSSTSIQTLWECMFRAWTTDIYVGGEMNQSFALT